MSQVEDSGNCIEFADMRNHDVFSGEVRKGVPVKKVGYTIEKYDIYPHTTPLDFFNGDFNNEIPSVTYTGLYLRAAKMSNGSYIAYLKDQKLDNDYIEIELTRNPPSPLN